MIPESFKQELLARVDIVDIIDPRVPLKKAGSNFSACCPFHTEKSPSFTVSPTKQFYHCFGCGAHGNAISFLMEYGGLGYIDALRELADGAGMKLPAYEPQKSDGPDVAPAGPDLAELMAKALGYYREQLKKAPHAIEYLKGRGLTGPIAARYGVGYAPAGWQNLEAVFPDYKDASLLECGLVTENEEGRRYDRFRDRIMFPIINPRGQVIGFGGRIMGQKQDGAGPKYLNSPETPLFEKGRELYGLREAREGIRKADQVIVVEGYMDVIALAQHGVDNAVATLGTATTPTHLLKLFRQTNQIVFCFDGDAAGRKAAWHALDIALGVIPDGKLARFLFLPPEHDPDSFVREQGADAYKALARDAQPLSAYLLEELARRHPIDSAEGRSHLVHEARPLLAKMVAPSLQLQLLKAVAEAAGMTQEEVVRLTGLGAAAPTRPNAVGAAGGPYSNSGRSGWGWRPSAPPERDRAHAALIGRLERELLLRILVAPELAGELPLELIPGESPERNALRAVAEYFRDTGGDCASAIEHFRDSPFEQPMVQAQTRLIELSLTVEQARPDFLGILNKLIKETKDHEINRLRDKSESGPLSAEEKQRLLRLLTESDRLKQPLDSPV